MGGGGGCTSHCCLVTLSAPTQLISPVPPPDTDQRGPGCRGSLVSCLLPGLQTGALSLVQIVEILCSHWLKLTMLVCCYGMISGFHALKGSIIAALIP